MITMWLAAGYADGSGSAMGRIALVAVAVLAVAAYLLLLLLKGRSGRARAGRRRYDPWDWRTYPPDSRPGSRDTGVPYGPFAVGHRGRHDQRAPLLSRGRLTRARRPFQVRFRLPKVFVTVTGRPGDWQRLVVLAADTGGASRC